MKRIKEKYNDKMRALYNWWFLITLFYAGFACVCGVSIIKKWLGYLEKVPTSVDSGKILCIFTLLYGILSLVLGGVMQKSILETKINDSYPEEIIPKRIKHIIKVSVFLIVISGILLGLHNM